MPGMDDKDAAKQFAAMFSEIYRRFHRRVPHTEYQLTSESLAVVHHLADSGPLTITEVARHMDRSQAAMSELIAGLVERGLPARMRDERERRPTMVWLTETRRQTLDQARSVFLPTLLAKTT